MGKFSSTLAELADPSSTVWVSLCIWPTVGRLRTLQASVAATAARATAAVQLRRLVLILDSWSLDCRSKAIV
jgi:hypothetical protein